MKIIAASYISAAICMLVLDAIWLSTSASLLYRPLLGDLLADNFRLAPAVVFYLVYVAGIVFLAVLPAVEAEKWQTAAINGLVLGLVAYATYDLTNQATLRTWSTTVTAIDIAWGGILTSITAITGYLGASFLRA